MVLLRLCITAKKYQQHLNNIGVSMHVVEIFGSDMCFLWMTMVQCGAIALGLGIIFMRNPLVMSERA